MEEHHMQARRTYGIRGKILDYVNQNDFSERLKSLVHPKDGACSDA